MNYLKLSDVRLIKFKVISPNIYIHIDWEKGKNDKKEQEGVTYFLFFLNLQEPLTCKS